MQEGVQDGSGIYYASVDVVEVASNQLVARGYEAGNAEEETPISREDVLKKLFLRLNLGQYGFDGKNSGAYLLARPNTDFSGYINTVFSREYWAQGGASSSVQTYSLEISEADVEGEPEYCWAGSKLLELTMTQTDMGSGAQTKVLQKDTQLPTSRECAYDYSVQFVISSGDSVAVMVRYLTTGFEGPDYRYIAVTTKFSRD
jgi:predicted secreted protein